MKRIRHLKHKQPKPLKRNKKKPPKKKTEKNINVVHHPLYGDIPLINVKETGSNGKEYFILIHDPDYSPVLPPGTLRGDIRKQIYCPMCNTPKYFYLDEEKKCVQCGKDFIFSAKEQKYWYESLRFALYSTAIRCKKCRKQKRTLKALNRQMSKALECIKKEPDNPSYLLQFIESTVKYYQMTNEGNLEKAINFCRKALKVYPSLLECIFWEAECLRLLKFKNKAMEKYREFYNISKSVEKYAKYRKIIEKNSGIK